MWGIKMQGPAGRLTASGVNRIGEIAFGYDTAVWKTKAAANAAVKRVLNLSPGLAGYLSVYECNDKGWALSDERKILVKAVVDCLPDLDLYVLRSGPGPDRRLAALKKALLKEMDA